MLFRAEGSRGQKCLPMLQGRSLIGGTACRQGGEIHRPGGVQSHLQIASVQEWVKAFYGNRQNHQAARLIRRQGPALRQLMGAFVAEQIAGHAAPRSCGDRFAGFTHQRRQGQKRCSPLPRCSGLGQGRTAADEFNRDRVVTHRLRQHSHPER